MSAIQQREEELRTAIGAGDCSALGELLLLYQEGLYAYFCRLLRNRDGTSSTVR